MSDQMRTVLVPRFGGPEVYEHTTAPRPAPDEDQVLVDLRVAGVNYLDVVQRSGGTPLAAPFRAGVEGLGILDRLSSTAAELGFQEGQRVGWLTGGQGSFSTTAAVDPRKLVAIPDEIDDVTGVAALMQGITAHYLTADTFPVAEDDVVLVHAAAGGLGQMLTQIAVHKGATVIGTVSSPEKAEVARTNGAAHVLGYEDFASQVREITEGEGASIVYDGVGGPTVEGSIASTRVRGTVAMIGAAGGPVPPIEVGSLSAAGSLFLTRPTVVHHIRTPAELQIRAQEVFGLITGGALKVSVGGTYPISELREAFTALESRETTGKLVLRL